MKKERLSALLFAIALAAIVCILGYGGTALYHIQREAVRMQVVGAMQEVAKKMQKQDLTIINNLAGALDDEDMNEKTAFAAGITGNTGMMRVWFDENELASLKQQKEQEERTGKPVLKLDKNYMKANNIQYHPQQAEGIQQFDSMFGIALQQERLNISYNIHRQTPTDTVFSNAAYQYASPFFILSFFKPQVYRIDFSIAPVTVLRKLSAYILVCAVLLILLTAAYTFMHRSYRLQAQMARFRESLFSNVAHELKTPLSSLQLVVDSTAEGQPLSATHRGYAQAELTRMNLIVEKILAYGKMDAAQFELNKEVVDVDDIIRSAIQAMAPAIQLHSAVVSYNGIPGIRLAGDRVLLINTITTLIDNALKYNMNTPYIKINAQHTGGYLQLGVTDNGIGIEHEYYRYIFQPFFRIPTANLHDVKGHGLGLSLAAQVVALHNGSITVASNTHGSTFIINIPIA